MTVEETKRRPLNAADLRYMNLPEEFWKKVGCRLNLVPQSVVEEFSAYLTNLGTALEQGTGLLLTGDAGVGKTAMAAIACKAARLRRLSVFFSTVWELREYVRSRVQFDADTTMLTRTREVDLLVLDELSAGDADQRFLGDRDLAELVKTRSSRCRITIITSRLNPRQLNEVVPLVKDAAVGRLLTLAVRGPDLRKKRAEQNRARLLKRRDSDGSR